MSEKIEYEITMWFLTGLVGTTINVLSHWLAHKRDPQTETFWNFFENEACPAERVALGAAGAAMVMSGPCVLLLGTLFAIPNFLRCIKPTSYWVTRPSTKAEREASRARRIAESEEAYRKALDELYS